MYGHRYNGCQVVKHLFTEHVVAHVVGLLSGSDPVLSLQVCILVLTIGPEFNVTVSDFQN